MADEEDHTEESKAQRNPCDLHDTRSMSAPCETEEPRNLMWWERFCDGLEEAVPECPVRRMRRCGGGGEGWKKNEINQLTDLWCWVSDKKSEECEEVDRKRRMGENGFEEKGLDESDFSAQKVIIFREFWNRKWHGIYGSFEDVMFAALIRPMKYTYDHAPPLARPCDALQIYSAKVVLAITGDLPRWPLHVFGMVAVRDFVFYRTRDNCRNFVFYRTRDNCQTLSETDPYLELTGPTRTVVVTKNDDAMVEVYLKLKGNTENEDRYLIHYADHISSFSRGSYISDASEDNFYPFLCHSKHGILHIRVGEIRSSVEATIFVRVVDGLWPDGFHGHFAARNSSDERQYVVLLDFGAVKVSVDGDGYMNLSRQVVSVELEGSLEVRFMAWKDDKALKECQDDNEIVNGEVRLKPEKAGRSYASLRLGSCVMEVLVAWSQVLPEPHPDVPDSFEDYPCPA